MLLTFHGHACVSLVSDDGRVVVLDPYLSGAFGGRISHAPVRMCADVVCVSHYHVDHSHVTADLGPGDGTLPEVLDSTGSAAGIDFKVRTTYHDREQGTRMGMTGMFAFALDHIRIAHLGDIGCDLTPEDTDALGPVDLLLWPVGGIFTLGPEDAPAVLDALQPRLAIPLHFENARCQLGMAPVEALSDHLTTPPERPGQSSWDSAQGLPEKPTVLILEPEL